MLCSRVEKQIPSVEAPLMAFTAEGGVEPKGERYDRSYLVKSDKKLYKRTEYNDFIYSSNNLDVGSIGLNKYGTAVISDVYEIFYTKKDTSPTFVSELIQRPHILSEVLKYRQGCLYGQYRIYAEDFLKVSVYAPSINEQTKISAFLDSLDKKIAAQHRLVEALKKYKRGAITRLLSGKAKEFSAETSWTDRTLAELCCEFMKDLQQPPTISYGLRGNRSPYSLESPPPAAHISFKPEMVGHQYGWVKIISAEKRWNKKMNRCYVLTECVGCGSVQWTILGNLTSGKSKGCQHCSQPRQIPLWLNRRLTAAKQRCENSNDAGYHNYGARGIQFDFTSVTAAGLYLIQTFGLPEREMEIDRIDNNGNYAPGNIHFVTHMIFIMSTK